MTINTQTAADLTRAYYASWTGGPDAFDGPTLREILAPDLVFEGPLAGHRVGAEGFIRGVQAVGAACRSFTLIQQVQQGNDVAVLYECELTRPAGTHRFAEFFRIENGRIQSINLVYDGTEWRKLTS
jgi:ketosteroid isomerase-like protein